MSEVLDETEKSINRMQEFNIAQLPREQDLGSSLNFKEVVRHAEKLISLYKRLSPNVLNDLPDDLLNQVKSQADADFSKLQQILDFKTDQDNPSATRQQFIQQIEQSYDPAFKKLYPFISYGASVAVDFQRMETDARAMIQSVRDQTEQLIQELSTDKEQAQQILEDVRKVAAEQGVSQQAIYFKEESESHLEQAEEWQKRIIWLGGILGVYALLTFFMHKIPIINPETTIQAVQLVASKILVFLVISYGLFLSTKNFLSHKHNATVNKHRQNALMTFKAIADASPDDSSKDIILTHASACIFVPQDTGYLKTGGNASNSESKSFIDLLPKSLIKVDG